MSCVNFKTKEKNNKWREVALDLEKEKSIPKYFGVDTETRVDELLQNNITLFDWIRKNQGFPYFIGRRINGENALTSEEMSYIASNGSKVIPILTAVSEKSAKDNAKIAITLLDDLKIERNTPGFVEIDAEKVTDEFLKDFATEVLSGGNIPGFYVDTDSYNNFDRLFSRAYQANEELMKQCKIWALSPEMEEFYETKNGHNEKPDIWGPFAPSCISKEQISFWQYGRKCHPINTYKGDKADFNLNLTIEPDTVFEIKDVEVVNFNFTKSEKCTFDACIKSDNALETISINCDFNKVKSESLLTDNKIYASNIISGHKILDFVICANNDLLSPEYTVTKGKVLIKLAFVSNEKSCVYHLRMLISLAENNALKEIVEQVQLIEEDTEIQNLSNQEMWATKFFKENISNVPENCNENSSIVKNFIYKANEDIFESEIISPMLARSNIIGDTHYIFESIPESIVKNVGDQYCTLKNVNGEPSLAYYKDTIYQNGYYATAIAIWDISPDLSNSTTHTNKRVVTLEFKKAYNVFTYYYPNSNEIHVLFSDENSSYIMNTHTQISIKLTGCQTAYIENCSFEMSLGGSNGSSNSWALERLLGLLGDTISNLLDVYSFLSDAINTISNYMFDKNKNEYILYPECNLVTKQVGSTFKSALNKKYALLKVRAILNNVTVYPTSRIFCQAQTTVTRISGGQTCVYFGGSIPLE